MSTSQDPTSNSPEIPDSSPTCKQDLQVHPGPPNWLPQEPVWGDILPDGTKVGYTPDTAFIQPHHLPLDLAFTRWSVVHRQWHELANDCPNLGAFLAGWFCRTSGVREPEHKGVLRDSFRAGWREASDHVAIDLQNQESEQKQTAAVLPPSRIITADGKEWWVHAPGDPMPCHKTMMVEVRLSTRRIQPRSSLANSFCWGDGDYPHIIAWRPANAPDILPRQGGAECI